MEDDVEVELELEKQLSLAHEMFWQPRPYYEEKQILLNNVSQQRKTSNFEVDEFPKKQSNLCFSSCLLPCTLKICEGKSTLSAKSNFSSTLQAKNYNSLFLSVINISLVKAYTIIQKWAYA